MPNITDTFIVRIPVNGEPAGLIVQSEYEDQIVSENDEFTVVFDYRLGDPKLDEDTPFSVGYTSVPAGYTASNSRFTPTSPQHTKPDPQDSNRRIDVRPRDWQEAQLDAVAPEIMDGETADQIVVTGTILAVQPANP